ncbi:hypothetical protein GCM10009582_27660 [Arthrobacter flavus]
MQVHPVAHSGYVLQAAITQRSSEPVGDSHHEFGPVLNGHDDPLDDAFRTTLNEPSVPSNVRPGVPHIDNERSFKDPRDNITGPKDRKTGHSDDDDVGLPRQQSGRNSASRRKQMVA